MSDRCNCPHADTVICTAVKHNTPATVIEERGQGCQCQCHYADAVLLPGVLISYGDWVARKITSYHNKVR